MITVFELITILSLFVLTVALYLSGDMHRPLDVEDESMTMWTMRARRVGPSKWRVHSFLVRGSNNEKIRLTEGTLIVGNRFKDECSF